MPKKTPPATSKDKPKTARTIRHSTAALPRLLIDIDEVATALATTPWSVRQWIKHGFLKAVAMPSTRSRRSQGVGIRRLLFDPADVAAFVQSMKEGTR